MRRYGRFMKTKFRIAAGFLFAAWATTAHAQSTDDDTPYWASVRVGEVNMRVGPAETYRIVWTYHRPQLPMKVLRRNEGWRLVEDPDGERGWLLARFLSRERTGIVKGKGLAEMRAQGAADSRLLWRVEPGVVGKLGDCSEGWCRFDIKGRTGYLPENRLWGSGAP